MARKGLPFTSIQRMARHSSNVIYVEDAWMEAPRADLQLQDMSSVCELANSILARVDCVEEAVKSAEEQLSEAVSQLSPDAWKFQNKVNTKSEDSLRRSEFEIKKVAPCTERQMYRPESKTLDHRMWMVMDRSVSILQTTV